MQKLICTSEHGICCFIVEIFPVFFCFCWINFGIACLNTNRNAIIVEKDEQTFERMKDNIVNTMKDKSEASISIKEVDLDEDMDMEMELM